MKQIERYIQFAIDNGYIQNIFWKYEKIIDLCIWNKQTFIWLLEKPWFTAHETFNNIEMFTSKYFIKAVASWIIKSWKKSFKLERAWLTNIDWEWLTIDTLIQRITIDQAIAIRDDKLEEFIEQLLPLLPKE